MLLYARLRIVIHTYTLDHVGVYRCVRACVLACVRACVRACLRAFVRACVRARSYCVAINRKIDHTSILNFTV